MADDFQGRVCGESWWNSSRSMFGSSLCSSGAINIGGSINIGGFGWPNELFEMKTSSSAESASASDGSVVLQDVQKPHQPDSANGTGNISMDSTPQMMNSGLSTSTITSDWSQALFQNNGTSESNYSSMLHEDLNSGMNYRQESGMDCPQMLKEWSPKNYTSVSEDYSTNRFMPVNECFALPHQHLNSITCSGDYTATSRGPSTSFSMNSSSYNYPSNLQHTLFDANPQPQKSLFDNQSMNFPSTTSYLSSLNNLSPPLPKFSPMLKASLTKQQSPITQFPFSNNTSLWNASAAALNEIRASLLPSSQLQNPSSTVNEKLNLPNLTAKPNNGEVARKTNDEPVFKRQRIETPSPLPTFKVRKEKMGDRITALQQLVSPFGKTDTASVLHEAIDYIKFLHDQVSVLSTPYLKNGHSDIQLQPTGHKLKDQDGPTQDLRSRGLCLVPISSTFPDAAETTTDFWTPTFAGAFSKQKGEALQLLGTQLISY